MPRGNAENLKPFRFKPGQSGNPSGRPKRKPVSDRYEALMDLPLPDNVRRVLKLDKGATYGDALAYRIVLTAIKGRPDAAKEIREAIEGKARQRVELTGEDGKPINVKASGPQRPLKGMTPERLQAIIKLAEKLEGQGASEPPPSQ